MMYLMVLVNCRGERFLSRTTGKRGMNAIAVTTAQLWNIQHCGM